MDCDQPHLLLVLPDLLLLVLLVLGLVAGDADLLRVDDDDVVASVHVRREFGFMLAAQALRHFGGQPAEDLVTRVQHVPIAFDRGRRCSVSFH